ncbi:HNH endonuclease [Haloarchaeobius sp. TZWWS8]|uniref:HNH endonuclease n=1 Tax=Haloarchaeobius sp. TZWWS8 TaxID=3446121 RepID=UPI003EBBF85E
MADDRRLTTDRFYGGTSQRLHLLEKLLRFVSNASGATTRSEAKGWVLENTRAESPDAINHHFGFLNAIELIDIDDDEISLGERGHQYLETPDSSVLYDALQSNVIGFNSILSQLLERPMTDEDIMHHLRDEFEDVEMESPGVASRHREWLQVLGYVERSDGVNRLTEDGRGVISGDGSVGNTDREKVRELRSHLLRTDMSCVSPGRQSVTDVVYEAVKETYPSLCDDAYLCSEAHDTGRKSPEWKHVVQEALQQLADKDSSRIRRDEERGIWMFLPRFQQGNIYRRKEIHDEFGGQRQRGISPCRDVPVIFLFTSFSETDEGYRDTIEEDGTVVYTGEGTAGDMTFDHGNKAIRDHREDERELHLFRTLDDGQVEYVGQYLCTDWFREELSDSTGTMRDAIRFELSPLSRLGKTDEVDIAPESHTQQRDTTTSDEPDEAIKLPRGSRTTERREFTSEDVIRNEALVRQVKRMHDHNCQICGEKRLQGPEDGYSEVHHLMPLGEDGPDIPENVVVVCPNHHVDFENGMISIDPRTKEITHFYDSEISGRELLVEDGHQVGPEYLAYNNHVVAHPLLEEHL